MARQTVKTREALAAPVRRDRPALRDPQGWLHARAQDARPQGRRGADGVRRARRPRADRSGVDASTRSDRDTTVIACCHVTPAAWRRFAFSVYSARRVRSIHPGVTPSENHSMRDSFVVRLASDSRSFACRGSGNDPDSLDWQRRQQRRHRHDPAGPERRACRRARRSRSQGVVVTAIDTFGAQDRRTSGSRSPKVARSPACSSTRRDRGDGRDARSSATSSTISGAVKDEFALSGSNADPTGRTDTELEPRRRRHDDGHEDRHAARCRRRPSSTR